MTTDKTLSEKQHCMIDVDNETSKMMINTKDVREAVKKLKQGFFNEIELNTYHAIGKNPKLVELSRQHLRILIKKIDEIFGEELSK